MIIEPVVSEKSYALMAEGKYTFRVDDRAHKTQIAHAVEEIFGVDVAAVRHRQGPREAEAPRPALAARPASGRRRSSSSRPGDRIELFEGAAAELAMADPQDKADQPRAPLRDLPAARGGHRRRARSKPLTEGKRKSGGRNSNGRVTARHRGGGAKRRYRQIDFKRRKDGVPAKVATIEYDPNRTATSPCCTTPTARKSYILAPQGLGVGATVQSGPKRRHPPGNALPLGDDPDRHASSTTSS